MRLSKEWRWEEYVPIAHLRSTSTLTKSLQRSEIVVDVTLNSDLSPKKVVLSGHAVEVMKGELVFPLSRSLESRL